MDTPTLTRRERMVRWWRVLFGHRAGDGYWYCQDACGRLVASRFDVCHACYERRRRADERRKRGA